MSIALTHGCETRVMNDTGKRRLEVFELWGWMCMEKISRVKRRTNVFKTVKEKRTFVNVIRALENDRERVSRHSDDLRNIVIEVM